MNKRYLWVIEMEDGGEFTPTVGVRLSREDGRQELKEWKYECPADKFRLVKYVPEGRGDDRY